MAARKVTIQIHPILKGLGKVQKGLAGLQKDLGKLANQGNAVTSSVRNMVGAFIGLTAATRGGKFIAKTVADFETLETQLVTVLGGSKELANVEFTKLQDFSKRTPFLLRNVTDSFIQLQARGIKVTEKDLENIGNVSAAFGRDITSFSNAVGQAVAGEAEPLKRFGIGLSFQGKKAVLTVDGVKKTIKRDGKVIAKELINLGATKFEGGIRRQAQTLGGLFSTLKDNVDIFVFEMGKAGLTDALKEVVKIIKEWFAGNKKLAQSLGREAGKAVLQFLKMILKLAKQMQQLRKRFKEVRESVGGFKKAIQALIAVLGTMAIVKAFMMLWGVIQAVGAAALAMFGGAGVAASTVAIKFIALIGAITAAIVLLFFAVDDVVTFFRGGDSLIGRFLKNIKGETEGTFGRINGLIQTSQSLWEEFRPTFVALVEFLGTVLPGAVRAFLFPAKVLWALFETGLSGTMLGLSSFLNFIRFLIAIFQGDLPQALAILQGQFSDIWMTMRDMIIRVIDLALEAAGAFSQLFGGVGKGVVDYVARVKGEAGTRTNPIELGGGPPAAATAGLAAAPAPGRAAGAQAPAGPTTINVNAPVNASGVTDPEKVADMAGKKIGAEVARANKQAHAQTAGGQR